MIGPKGLERVVNALRVIAPELPFEIRFIEIAQPYQEVRMNGYVIKAFKVNHKITCYGYSIEIERAGMFDVTKSRSQRYSENVLEQGFKREKFWNMKAGRLFRRWFWVAARKGLKVTYTTDTRPTKSNYGECPRGRSVYMRKACMAKKEMSIML